MVGLFKNTNTAPSPSLPFKYLDLLHIFIGPDDTVTLPKYIITNNVHFIYLFLKIDLQTRL